MTLPSRFLVLPDLHFPYVHWPTWRAVKSYASQNPLHGCVFLGDQFDNHSISHHTEGKPGQRIKGAFKSEEEGFERHILTPLESILGRSCTSKVWIEGNHDTWTEDLNDLYPQLRGCFDRPTNLRLKRRGWTVLRMGRTWKHGKLFYAHGETLSGQYHSRKAVDTFCRNLVYGHFHSPQSHTKVLPQDQTQKWMATCLPILGSRNPDYLENRPTAWVNGFGLVEYHGEGLFNLYSIVVSKGRFSYGGRVYQG